MLDKQNINLTSFTKTITQEIEGKEVPVRVMKIIFDDTEKMATLVLNEKPVLKGPTDELVMVMEDLLDLAKDAYKQYKKK